jgi:hypothetical protein
MDHETQQRATDNGLLGTLMISRIGAVNVVERHSVASHWKLQQEIPRAHLLELTRWTFHLKLNRHKNCPENFLS